MTDQDVYVTPDVSEGNREVPLEVTMDCPGPSFCWAPPTFIARVNKPATMDFYLDGVYQKSDDGLIGRFTPDHCVETGKHTVKVIAIRKCGQSP